jgi:MFS family permease
VPRLLADVTPLRVSPQFRRLWAALGISSIGQQMTAVAVGIQVYNLTGSPLAVGMVGLFQLVPLVGFGLYGGALSDSRDRRRLGLLTATGLMCCSIGLLVQSAAGVGSVALIYGLVAVQSAFFAVGNPARQALIPRLVGIELLPAANALGMLSWGLGFTLGPLLGGLVIAVTGGESAAYALDAVAFTATMYAMWRLRPMPPLPGAPRTAGWASVVQGIQFLRGRKNLQMSFYVDIAAMVFGMPRALFPALAATFYPGTTLAKATIVGLLSAAPAVGAVVSSALSGPLSHARRQGAITVGAVVVWGLAIAAFGFVHVLWVGLVLLALAGAADNVSAVMRQTILQAATPDEYRGRLQGIFTVVVAGGPRLGDVESGGVATLFGEAFSVVSGGLACLAAVGALVLVMPQFLRYDARHPTP